ncbi:hypothetical protein ANO11243_006570 [Dothideomycetidae sp. 11243]|nr:hypothetical protein ANO11243_006570 [fungal sp. No.11243]
MATSVPITGETPIIIKISIGEDVKKLKLPLKDLTAELLPAKLISILNLPTDKKVIFERFSDSAGGFITLNPDDTAVYKTLVRAAKAKLKLRLRALIEDISGRPEIIPGLSKLPQPSDRSKIINFQRNFKQMHGPASHPIHQPNIPQWKDVLQLPSVDGKAQIPATLSPSTQPNAPVSFPDAYGTDMKSFTSQCEPVLVFRRKSPSDAASSPKPTWSVYCNECDATLHNEHFHCSICDGGDYDLCQRCVNDGKLCPGQGHWLVKRFVKDGMIISSTTERLPPKLKPAAAAPVSTSLPIRQASFSRAEKIIPGAFTDDAKTLADDLSLLTRTCNSCVEVMTDDQFVTCTACEDFDLCLKCHVDNKHGHHPGHRFEPAEPSKVLNYKAQALLAPGRHAHHFAVCDGCEKNIVGIRHKCFDCPDFDYCNDCVRTANLTHPDHRFAALYEPIALVSKRAVIHHGVYCDGPACSSNPRQTYITGVRYKCAICNDTDFCANCEALPICPHNKTHPLIKITSPIRGLSVSTMNDTLNGRVSGLGDRSWPSERPSTTSTFGPCAFIHPPTSNVNAASFRSPSKCLASPVKTVAFNEPTPAKPEQKKPDAVTSKVAETDKSELQAVFVCDTIPDGITVRGDTRFTQVWTMRNPGPNAWPAGCSVRLTGGDNMLNVDRVSPFSASTMAQATESNVTGREVLPGEEISFKVVLKAPNRNGKAISYWRLKTADGNPFGHRLWCDINVRAWDDQKDDRSRFIAPDSTEGAGKEVLPPTEPMVQKSVNVSESPMVFPTLEKESLASSIIDLNKPTTDTPIEITATSSVSKPATVEDEATGDVVSAALSAKSSEEAEDDVFEDISSEIEVLSASGEGSEDDGFMTDEEYDILDASDQETIASTD